METKSIRQRDRCHPTIMEEFEGLCLAPILSNRESSEKSGRRNGNNSFNNSSLTRAVVVPNGNTKSQEQETYWGIQAPQNTL